MVNLLEKSEAHRVKGEIYKITNLLTEKMYIGQTRSHYLNRGKYRPFGHIGRFKSHISESKSLSKSQMSCRYLNSAFNKYGIENFKCELILICEIDELDKYETHYISEYNTKYPNGYNLTNGGQKCGFEKGKKIILDNSVKPKTSMILNANLKRSDETKQLISQRLIEYKKDPNIRKCEMKRVQKIHSVNRFEKYKDIVIDKDNIEKYISIIKNNTLNYDYIRVTFGKMRTTFVGKYETIEEIKQRARQFILDILEWQRIQTAGTSLEPSLPLTLGNICEELG
jgi:group I intron endonuclease